jgi:hypothetical protein
MSLLLPPTGSDLRGLFEIMDLLEPASIITIERAREIAAAARAFDPAVQSMNFIARTTDSIVLLTTDGTSEKLLWRFGSLVDAGLKSNDRGLRVPLRVVS